MVAAFVGVGVMIASVLKVTAGVVVVTVPVLGFGVVFGGGLMVISALKFTAGVVVPDDVEVGGAIVVTVLGIISVRVVVV